MECTWCDNKRNQKLGNQTINVWSYIVANTLITSGLQDMENTNREENDPEFYIFFKIHEGTAPLLIKVLANRGSRKRRLLENLHFISIFRADTFSKKGV